MTTTMNSESISANSTRLLQLLLKVIYNNLSILHYIAYDTNLFICRKLAGENSGKIYHIEYDIPLSKSHSQWIFFHLFFEIQ